MLQPELKLRRDKIRSLMAQQGIEAALITCNANLIYTYGCVVSGYLYLPLHSPALLFFKRPNNITGEHSFFIRKPEQITELLKEQGLIDSNTSIGRVIRYLQNQNLFQYEACRVTSPQSRRLNSDHNKPTPIGKANNSYTVHLQPPFQICFYSSHSLNLRNYKVIYPEQYREGYGV